MNKKIIEKINNIQTQEEYKELLDNFTTSNVDIETKEKYIKLLTEKFENDIMKQKNILKEIEDSSADIDDINQ